MNLGYVVAILGVLGIIVGAGMYLAPWHRTIGLGGIVLGVILLIVGVWYSRTARTVPAKTTSPAAQ